MWPIARDKLSQILLTGLASAIFTGVLAFLFQSFIKQWLSRNLEEFKVNLQLAAFEHQTRFTKLHEKRAEVIAELYKRLVKTERGLRLVLDTIPGLPPEHLLEETLRPVLDSIPDFSSYFEMNSIYLDGNVCGKLKDLNDEFQMALAGTLYYLEEDPGSTRGWEIAFETLTEKIPPIKESIEREFRKMLGLVPGASEES